MNVLDMQRERERKKFEEQEFQSSVVEILGAMGLMIEMGVIGKDYTGLMYI